MPVIILDKNATVSDLKEHASIVAKLGYDKEKMENFFKYAVETMKIWRNFPEIRDRYLVNLICPEICYERHIYRGITVDGKFIMEILPIEEKLLKINKDIEKVQKERWAKPEEIPEDWRELCKNKYERKFGKISKETEENENTVAIIIHSKTPIRAVKKRRIRLQEMGYSISEIWDGICQLIRCARKNPSSWDKVKNFALSMPFPAKYEKFIKRFVEKKGEIELCFDKISTQTLDESPCRAISQGSEREEVPETGSLISTGTDSMPEEEAEPEVKKEILEELRSMQEQVKKIQEQMKEGVAEKDKIGMKGQLKKMFVKKKKRVSYKDFKSESNDKASCSTQHD